MSNIEKYKEFCEKIREQLESIEDYQNVDFKKLHNYIYECQDLQKSILIEQQQQLPSDSIREDIQKIVKKYIEEDNDTESGEFSLHDTFGEILDGINLQNWPNARVEEGEDDDGNMIYEYESADLENFEIIDITEDRITMCCGGDWQDPVTFDIVKRGTMYFCENVKFGYEKGLTSYRFLRKLFQTDTPEVFLNTDRVKLMDWWEKKDWGEKDD